jgi:carbamoyl-phosphate synthase large subunit
MTNKPITVLITGVGAIIGYGLINSLRKSKYECRIIGIDIFHDAVGQKWCDTFIQGVRADSEDFIPFINNIVENEKVDLLIPGIEQDLKTLIDNFERLNHTAKYSLNNKALYQTFDDKKLTYKFLEGIADLIPYVDYSENLFEEAKEKFGLPFILKQDISYASKGVALINEKKDFDFYIDRFGSGCMAQQKLDIKNREYTCALFGLGDGTFVNPISLRRELSQEGATKKALNVKVDDTLLGTMEKICQKCQFEGPTNLQFIEYEGKYLLLEINGRVSSSTSMRELFGVNEAEMCVDYYLNDREPETKVQRYGTIMRYIGDAYFDSDTL